MEGCSKEKSRREGEIIRKGPRRMGPFGPLNSDIGKLYWERKDVVFSSGSGIFTTQAQIDSRLVVGCITNNNANIGVGTITVSGYDATIRLTDGTISGTYAVSLFYKKAYKF